ncbi:unnamed protein product [Allacma fusca]|uniref:Uncharacterized protein n=1 Tax=Allacma fusca TaxID=39272 RepID=A0A8J2KZ43_9HEXA|nr:unnamed protein product [Allacma fusca]
MNGGKIKEKARIVELLSARLNDTARPGTIRGGLRSNAWHLSVCSNVALLFYSHAWLKMEHTHRYQFINVTLGMSKASESYTKKALAVSRKLLYPLKENTIENIVMSCDKIAYLDFHSKIMNLKIPTAMRNLLVKHPLILSTEKLFASDIGVSIDHDSGLLTFLGKVYQSGLFRWVEGRINALQESRLEIKYWLITPRRAQKLRFSSNFSQTLFSIYNILSCVCLGIFATEMFISWIFLN